MNKVQEVKSLIIDFMDFLEITVSETELLQNFFNLSKNSYVLVTWPDSQNFMEKDWFLEEAILDVDGKFGSSAYFIPIERMLENS